jgi:hypothetical protein
MILRDIEKSHRPDDRLNDSGAPIAVVAALHDRLARMIAGFLPLFAITDLLLIFIESGDLADYLP